MCLLECTTVADLIVPEVPCSRPALYEHGGTVVVLCLTGEFTGVPLGP